MTRNLICLTLVATLLGVAAPHARGEVNNQLTTSESLSGWKLLFDGKSTDGWRNYRQTGMSDGWKVVDGALVRAEKGAGDIVTKDKFKAFDLSLEYKVAPEGNSGVMFHVTENNPAPWHSGPEIQVQDNVAGHDPQKSGWLYQFYKPGNERNSDQPVDSTRPAGEWNQLFIRIAPTGCEVSMNGVLYYRFKLGDADWQKRLAASKFAKMDGFGAAGEGHICLQDHGDLVSYRNIKIRELKDDFTVPSPSHGELAVQGVLAYPNVKWEGWDPVDEAGNVRRLRMLELTFAKNDGKRVFAMAQNGMIFSLDNDAAATQSRLFLDLSDRVTPFTAPGANEQGLLGLAMHPNFKENGQFFVSYTAKDDDRSVVSRFRVSKDDPNRADPKSEEILMEIPQPFKNHNGGPIEFGPDGYLYVAMGDGGFRNDPELNGQDLSSLLGKILRIDVDHPADGKPYGIPKDNPFVSVEGACPEIYAYGLRNPWRMAFDSKTGKLWLGDVGQELWEEVNVIEKGGNYGWSMREGAYSFGNQPQPKSGPAKTIDPVWAYDHGVGKSITGGRVYRGSKAPELVGKYIFADYVSGGIWALTYDEASGKVTRSDLVVASGIPVLAFGEDADGEVYYMIDSAKDANIYRFESK
jgi:glucose/arabinose dehydrogenase